MGLEMGVYSVHLVGESHYQPAIRNLRAGERVTLVPEPDNPYDPRAVMAVASRGETIGYLERDGWLTRVLLDDGVGVSATIGEIIGGEREKPSLGVVLEVRTAADAGGSGAGVAGHAPSMSGKSADSGTEAQRMLRAQQEWSGGLSDTVARKGGLRWWQWVLIVIVALAALQVMGVIPEGDRGDDMPEAAVSPVDKSAWAGELRGFGASCGVAMQSLVEVSRAGASGNLDSVAGYDAAVAVRDGCEVAWMQARSMDIPDGLEGDDGIFARTARTHCADGYFAARQAGAEATKMFDGDWRPSHLRKVTGQLERARYERETCEAELAKLEGA